MNLISNLILNAYSISLLILIYLQTQKHIGENFLQHRLYIRMIQITILMLLVDVLSRFDGNPGSVYLMINHIGNFSIYLLNPVLPSLWILYAQYQIFHQEEKTKRWTKPLIGINAINVVMLVLSQFWGWYYYIDADNIYHRGSLFWFPVSITFVLILFAFVLIIGNRKRIERRYYFSLVFFAIPPFVCVILQIFFYGISLMLNGVALSLMVVFFNIQNHSMYTDYLTGVYNRKKLETYMKEKISMSTRNRSFSAILIDIDNFKTINDTFGHDIGDDALETSVKLIKTCVRTTDLIARFGGDEFYIILNTSNIKDLETTVSRINSCLVNYNREGVKPYKLGFSMGYAVYDVRSHKKMEDYQKQIDILMYENKRSNKNHCLKR